MLVTKAGAYPNGILTDYIPGVAPQPSLDLSTRLEVAGTDKHTSLPNYTITINITIIRASEARGHIFFHN